jgi:hypothetical protein
VYFLREATLMECLAEGLSPKAIHQRPEGVAQRAGGTPGGRSKGRAIVLKRAILKESQLLARVNAASRFLWDY